MSAQRRASADLSKAGGSSSRKLYHCRRNPPRAESGVRSARGTCESRASGRRVRMPAGPANQRASARATERRTAGGAGTTRRCGQRDCSAPSPEKACTPARARTSTPWAARTRARALECRMRFSYGFCPQQQNSHAGVLPELQS